MGPYTFNGYRVKAGGVVGNVTCYTATKDTENVIKEMIEFQLKIKN